MFSRATINTKPLVSSEPPSKKRFLLAGQTCINWPKIEKLTDSNASHTEHKSNCSPKVKSNSNKAKEHNCSKVQTSIHEIDTICSDPNYKSRLRKDYCATPITHNQISFQDDCASKNSANDAEVPIIPLNSPKQSKINSDDSENDEDEYYVDEIQDYRWCWKTCQGLYFVKWIGYPESTNTWEPLEHLDCPDKLKEFYALRLKERENALPGRKRFLEVPADPRTNFERCSEIADKICPPPCMSEVETFFTKLDKKKDKTWPQAKVDHQLELIARTKKFKDNKIYENRLVQLKEQIMLRHVKEKRLEQLQKLKEWEVEINDLDRSSKGNAKNAKITVENDYDLEGPPRHMKYMNSYKPCEGIIIPDDPPIGCECPEGKCGIKTEKTCCPSFNAHRIAYNFAGKLRVELGTPIYECNKRCKCDKECANRVVQKGRKVKLCIYRTSNGCGWGVRVLENIKKGSFVVEYVGEVITSEEAEERGKKYDAEGRTYLFDLDFNMGDQNPYTVDAAFFGNVSHFINHSCEPNLSIFNVWIDCLDPNLPRLCLFANRDISKNEQLSFDYRQRTGYETADESNQASCEEADQMHEPSKMECRCGSKKCRKILFG